MPESYRIEKYRLETLLKQVHDRDLALPDFQRDFVWDPDATEELLESIFRDFPTGSLLFMRHRDDGFQPRAFAGAPELNGRKPVRLVLDGQQRLTSLYQALYGEGEYSYYVWIEDLESGKPVEDALFHESKKRAKKLGYDDERVQAEKLLLPLRVIFGDPDGFSGWSRRIRRVRKSLQGAKAPNAKRVKSAAEKCGGCGKKKRDLAGHLSRHPECVAKIESAKTKVIDNEDLEERMSRFEQARLSSVRAYTYPYVELDESVSMEAICKIFETLNNTGVKLTVFELLAARYFAKDLKLRELWHEAVKKFPIIGKDGFDLDPTTVLQAVALRAETKDGHVGCQRTDLLRLSAADIHRHWAAAVAGMAAVLEMLQQECGVFTRRWVPYSTQLVPMAAVWDAVTAPKNAAVAANKLKLQRWFWRAIFRSDYESAANTQAADDFKALRTWFAGGAAPAALQSTPTIPDFRSVTPKQRATYSAAIALVARHGATDFHKGKKLTPEAIATSQIDDHHVFPRAHLGDSFPADSVNSVANRTLIDKQTNIRIGKRAPSAYLADMELELGDRGLEKILRSHLLPVEAKSALRRDEFEAFLAWRSEKLAGEALEAMGPNTAD